MDHPASHTLSLNTAYRGIFSTATVSSQCTLKRGVFPCGLEHGGIVTFNRIPLSQHGVAYSSHQGRFSGDECALFITNGLFREEAFP